MPEFPLLEGHGPGCAAAAAAALGHAPAEAPAAVRSTGIATSRPSRRSCVSQADCAHDEAFVMRLLVKEEFPLLQAR